MSKPELSLNKTKQKIDMIKIIALIKKMMKNHPFPVLMIALFIMFSMTVIYGKFAYEWVASYFNNAITGGFSNDLSSWLIYLAVIFVGLFAWSLSWVVFKWAEKECVDKLKESLLSS